jgi:hypothetical protein
MTIPGSSVIVEGHAIVSADGMISDAVGGMPPAMRNEADWRLFQAALDRAALVVIGRVGHERHPNRGRRRLVTTRQVADLAPDPGDSLATLWNPAGVSIDRALTLLGIADGVLAITGGAAAFDLFLPLYDRFALAEVPDLFIPDGRPCFSGGLPAIALKSAGLGARERAIIDPAAGVTLTMWTR